jgi:hypothetical protein
MAVTILRKGEAPRPPRASLHVEVRKGYLTYLTNKITGKQYRVLKYDPLSRQTTLAAIDTGHVFDSTIKESCSQNYECYMIEDPSYKGKRR